MTIERRFINAIIELNTVDRIIFEIDKELVNSTEEFKRDLFNTKEISDNRYIFERIGMCRDITQLYLTYNDGSNECFQSPWADGDDYHNSNQKTYINKSGNLVVDIRKPYHNNRRRKRN